MEFFESCYDLMSPLQFKDYVLSQRIKRLNLHALAEQSLLRANKLLDEHSKDGNTMNLSKLAMELKYCNPGDMKRVDDLIAAKEDIE